MTSAKGAELLVSINKKKMEENMIQVRELVHSNRDLTIHELVNVAGVSSGSSQNTFDTKSETMTNPCLICQQKQKPASVWCVMTLRNT
jgi:hypothetical protein